MHSRTVLLSLLLKGGYAYRLCKVPAAGISRVTEQCFQNGHLKFAGPYTWSANLLAGSEWQRSFAVRTNDIKGNPWNRVNLQPHWHDDDDWALKDFLHVPTSLEKGRYILSFRWDSQGTPQVWNSCANIDIV